MSNLERIFQAILFEIGAVLSTVLLMSVVTEHTTTMLTSTIILISLIALVWNFVFNFAFDKVFQGERVERSWKIRTLHTVLFELGLLCFTIPLVAFMLNIGWWEALVMDITMTLVVMIYTFIFHWCYDHIRYYLKSDK